VEIGIMFFSLRVKIILGCPVGSSSSKLKITLTPFKKIQIKSTPMNSIPSHSKVQKVRNRLICNQECHHWKYYRLRKDRLNNLELNKFLSKFDAIERRSGYVVG
jgi:hypothetical protein